MSPHDRKPSGPSQQEAEQLFLALLSADSDAVEPLPPQLLDRIAALKAQAERNMGDEHA